MGNGCTQEGIALLLEARDASLEEMDNKIEKHRSMISHNQITGIGNNVI